MALRSFGLLFLQTVAALPTLIARDGITCPAANGTTVESGGKSWAIECGIDTYQGDLPAPNGQHTATFDDCIKSCVDRSGCQAVAWLNQDACYLKGSVPRRLVKADVWGAVLANLGFDGALTSTVTNTATVTVTGSELETGAADAAPTPRAVAVDYNQPSAVTANPAASSLPSPSSGASTSPSTGNGGSCGSRPAAKTLATKRGVCYNNAALTQPFGGKVSWAYNWGQTPDGTLPDGTVYIPMLWSPTMPGSWASNAQKAIDGGADTLLYCNEPDIASQVNLDVATVVNGWKQYMEPFACKARLAAPAVSNGPAPMGLAWLKSFLSACADCNIDVVPIHWYDAATNIEYFKSYVQSAYEAGGKRPLWLTEFGARGSDAEIQAFFKAVLPWLDSQPYVERYTYFMASPGNLIGSGSSLSTIGQAYVNT